MPRHDDAALRWAAATSATEPYCRDRKGTVEAPREVSAFWRDWTAALERGASDNQLVKVAFDHCHRMVYGLARKITGTHWEAEDITQDVFAGLVERLRDVREPAAIPGYLRTCVIRSSAKLVAKNRKHREKLNNGFIPLEDDGSGPLSIASSLSVRGMLHRLEPEERSAILLKFVARHSHQEVAELIGVSVATARRRIDSARTKLAAWWREAHPDTASD